MIELRCDFNSGRSGTHFNSSSHSDWALAAHPSLADLGPLVQPGDRVLLRDGDGNSCEGIVEAFYSHQGQLRTCGVRLDLETWRHVTGGF